MLKSLEDKIDKKMDVRMKPVAGMLKKVLAEEKKQTKILENQTKILEEIRDALKK